MIVSESAKDNRIKNCLKLSFLTHIRRGHAASGKGSVSRLVLSAFFFLKKSLF